jgi:hypothetical protein
MLHQRRLEKEWVWPALDRTFRLTLFIKYRLSVIAPLSGCVQALDRIDIVEKEEISNITWRILVLDSEYAKLRAYLDTCQQSEEGMQSLIVVHGCVIDTAQGGRYKVTGINSDTMRTVPNCPEVLRIHTSFRVTNRMNSRIELATKDLHGLFG